MSDLTVVYYSASRESPGFEAGIVRELRKSAGNTPIISVTQKPLDCGQNICVGDLGQSVENALQQMLIGLREVKTNGVVFMESDCLIGPEFFSVTPIPGRWHYPTHAYIIWQGTYRFYVKNMRELVGVVCLEDALRIISEISIEKPPHISESIRTKCRSARFDTSQRPAITIKTDRQMHRKSPHGKTPVGELPFWGTATDVWRMLS